QRQCSEYITWINCQLKKRSDTKLVEDLTKDLCDGIVFAQLIRIVGRQKN
ncbi:hypothetical protein HELRODRAFT_73018, partial [Helobdella robusta]|uniref:Calponin-homology (CH) domain-containing protein n=1 Tax=Helobdella robusta TaxID=6412 RepID=T1G188_HELRO